MAPTPLCQDFPQPATYQEKLTRGYYLIQTEILNHMDFSSPQVSFYSPIVVKRTHDQDMDLIVAEGDGLKPSPEGVWQQADSRGAGAGAENFTP